MTRLQRVNGYWRRRPDLTITPPHVEMAEALRLERSLAELDELIAAELARDFGWPERLVR